MTEITTTARRIARRIKGKSGQSGFCLFDANGNGGCWYSNGSQPPHPDDYIRFPIPSARGVHLSARDVQDELDRMADQANDAWPEWIR